MDSMVDAKTPATIPNTEDTLTVGTPHWPVGRREALDSKQMLKWYVVQAAVESSIFVLTKKKVRRLLPDEYSLSLDKDKYISPTKYFRIYRQARETSICQKI